MVVVGVGCCFCTPLRKTKWCILTVKSSPRRCRRTRRLTLVPNSCRLKIAASPNNTKLESAPRGPPSDRGWGGSVFETGGGGVSRGDGRGTLMAALKAAFYRSVKLGTALRPGTRGKPPLPCAGTHGIAQAFLVVFFLILFFGFWVNPRPVGQSGDHLRPGKKRA